MHTSHVLSTTHRPDDASLQVPNQGLQLSEHLRFETQDAHRATEEGSMLTRFIATDLPKADSANQEVQAARAAYRRVYEAYLAASFQFERAVLENIRGFLGAGRVDAQAYFPEREDVLQLILNDRQAIHSSWTLDTPIALPEIDSLPALLGMEYVRRGSRNGNVVIAAKVRRNLGIGAESGAAFLNMHAATTHHRFAEVRSWLDSHALGPTEMAISIQVAIATFEGVRRFHQLIDQQLLAADRL